MTKLEVIQEKKNVLRRAVVFVFAASLLIFVTYGGSGAIFRDRSFFGAYTVDENGHTRWLTHGSTMHGLQFVGDLNSGKKPRILGYYHPKGPVGQVFTSPAMAGATDIGIIGLGLGSTACYAQPHQTWRFFEIDALVDRIARNPELFTYMEQCAKDIPTIVGDARITLSKQKSKFDVLLMDAYSSDAIPAHMITLEAMRLFMSRLKPDGLLVFHISNNYYDLEPVLGNIARQLGLAGIAQYYTVNEKKDEEDGQSTTHAVVISNSQASLTGFCSDARWKPVKTNGKPVWTDDHANLPSAIRFF